MHVVRLVCHGYHMKFTLAICSLTSPFYGSHNYYKLVHGRIVYTLVLVWQKWMGENLVTKFSEVDS